ncbi:MAG: hypothetical protein OWT27_06050, partial [Firmicutes bacterium]|nr:hypothetical protein [Bacillota bacterium]
SPPVATRKVERAADGAQVSSADRTQVSSADRTQVSSADRTQVSSADVSELGARWEDVLAAAKAEDVRYKAWLVNSRPLCVQGNRLVLACGGAWHASTLAKRQNREAIERIIAQVSGQSFVLEPVFEAALRDGGVPELSGAAAQMASASDAETGSPLPDWVGKVVELLGEDRVTIVE